MSISNKYLFPLPVLLILLLALAAACTVASPSAQDSDGQQAVEHNDNAEQAEEHGHEEHSHDDGRIPNNGAVIRITSPEDGVVFREGDTIVVEIETENFLLGQDGSHWHVYVDDRSFGMVTGGDTDQALRGLEPGQYEISAFLAFGSHEELEEGAKITITVVE